MSAAGATQSAMSTAGVVSISATARIAESKINYNKNNQYQIHNCNSSCFNHVKNEQTIWGDDASKRN